MGCREAEKKQEFMERRRKSVHKVNWNLEIKTETHQEPRDEQSIARYNPNDDLLERLKCVDDEGSGWLNSVF